jgi:hypothetical protein
MQEELLTFETLICSREVIHEKYKEIIKGISKYDIDDIENYRKCENDLMNFIIKNVIYLANNNGIVYNYYILDKMDRHLIIKDVDTDSLIFRAPEVIISYAHYIAKFMSVYS